MNIELGWEEEIKRRSLNFREREIAICVSLYREDEVQGCGQLKFSMTRDSLAGIASLSDGPSTRHWVPPSQTLGSGCF